MKSFQVIKQEFVDYLKKNNFRVTSERMAILEVIYNHNSHFNADSLYLLMEGTHVRVSKATVYNTLELLIRCNLITKFTITGHYAEYELLSGQNDYYILVCTECSKKIMLPQNSGKKKDERRYVNGFEIVSAVTNLFGKCLEGNIENCRYH